MELTEQNFTIYAAKYYDNPWCFNEDEFLKDLSIISTLKRMIAWANNGDEINVHLLVNNTVCFYNVFEHHAASELLEFKMNDLHYEKMNAILFFLSYPLLGDGEFDLMFHRRITQEFKNK